MNDILASIYRRDENSLFILLQGHLYKDRSKLDETLRVVLSDDSELQYHEKLHYAEMLLCAGASPNICNWNNDPMVIYAIHKEDTGIFDMLLNFAVDVNAVDDSNRSALHAASECGETSMVCQLLAAGASPNVQDEFGNTPLSLCFQHKDDELLEMLMIDSDISKANFNGQSPLHVAISIGWQEAISMLISRGANVNVQDKHGDTPLIVAREASDRNLDVIKVLLDSGADVNHINHNSNTALHKIYPMSDEALLEDTHQLAEIMTLLIDAGGNINARNLCGNSPLFVAVDVGNNLAAKILIQANCDLDACGNSMFGRVCLSILELAMMRDDLVAMAMVLLAGCRFKKVQVDKVVAHLMLSRLTALEHENDSKRFTRCMDVIRYMTTKPQSLQVMCRAKLRKVLGTKIKHKVNNLSLPRKIRDYIYLNELDQLLELPWNLLAPSYIIWCHKTCWTLIQVMAAWWLITDGTKPLPEPLLTYYL